VALAKEDPDRLNYASAGAGSVTFLAAEIFKDQAEVNMTHIPYEGGGASLRAIVAGATQVYFSALLVALPYVEDGRRRALAGTSKARGALLPDAPTVAESGRPTYAVGPWHALVAPAGTPDEGIGKIRSAAVEASKAPEVQKSGLDMGSTIVASEPEEFG